MTRAATYLRVSTEDQAERYGLAAQRYALAAALPGRRYTFVREYVDEGVSGATERRPHLDQCLADARAGQFDVLLTHHAWPATAGSGPTSSTASDLPVSGSST